MKEGERDYSIDFVKGVAILSVIFLHNMPADSIYAIVWIGQAVPLFLLITSFLTYRSYQRKGFRWYFSVSNLRKMLNRIFIPFFILIGFQCCIFYFFKGEIDWHVLHTQGGFGPGSYYPWIYLQCWLILPFVILLTNRLDLGMSCILFIGICALEEWLTSELHVPADIYRLLCFRYLFLLYLGCIFAKYRIKLGTTVYILAAVSLLIALTEIYTSYNFEPFLTARWKGYHWITYFYTLLVFLLIAQLYGRICQRRIAVFFVKLGVYSYEIFLFQMLVYSLISVKRFAFFGNQTMSYIAFVLVTTFLSIAAVWIYKEYVKKLYRRK